jgi:hypothetical protein
LFGIAEPAPRCATLDEVSCNVHPIMDETSVDTAADTPPEGVAKVISGPAKFPADDYARRPRGHDVTNGASGVETEATVDSKSRASVVWPTLMIVGVYAVLAVAIYWHVWSTHPTTVSQPGGDQFSNMWYLEWAPFSLLHGHNPLFTNFANYPFGVNLLTNTSSLFLGIIASPVTLIWGPIAAFNSVSTLALVASASAEYVFIRRWVAWRPAAFVGGLIYGFGPYEIGQSAGHTNLTFVAIPPLILLVVHEIVVRQKGRARTWGIVLGLLLTAQFFVSSEVMASTIVIGAICVVIVGILGSRHIRTHMHYLLVAAGWAAGVGAILLAYPVWFAVKGPGHISGPIQLVPQGYRADLLGPLYPDANQHFAPAHLSQIATNFANSPTENGSYLGVTLLAVLAIGTIVLWRRSTVVRVTAIAGVAAFIMSLGAGLVVEGNPPGTASGFPLPERIFTRLPLLSNTIPVRYSLYVELFAALLLGLILGALHDSLVASRMRSNGVHTRTVHDRTIVAVAIPAIVAVLALLPLLPAVPFTALGPVGTPTYFTSPALRQIPEGSVAVLYPYPSSTTPGAQAWQAVAGMRFRMPGGYFLVPGGPDNHIAFSPTLAYTRDTLTARVLSQLFVGTPPTLTPSLRVALLGEFRMWDVRSLVAFPAGTTKPDQAIAFFTSLLGVSPSVEADGAYAWYDIHA